MFTSFYRQSSPSEVRVYYPTQTEESITWTASDTDSSGPTIGAFNDNEEMKLEVYNDNTEAEILLEYYSSEQLHKNKEYLLNLCFSTDYKIIYGSVNISHIHNGNSYFYLQLSNHDSSLYKFYEKLVKSYFDQAFAKNPNLKGFYNTVVFSFSPNSYLNFAIEAINNPDFDADVLNQTITDYEKSLTSDRSNENQLRINVTSLQLSQNSDPACFEIVFPGSDTATRDHSEVTYELSVAIYEFCKLIRVCPLDNNPIEITDYRPTFFGSNGGKADFCVRSNLVKRQVIEAILNEYYSISSQLGDFQFNYEIQPKTDQLVILQIEKSGGFKRVAIWVIMTAVLALFVIILIFMVLFFVYKYWSSKKRLYNYLATEMDPLSNDNTGGKKLRKSTGMHQAALRASEMSLVVKTGPRQTFMRTDSQNSLQNVGTPQNNERNTSTRMYIPRGGGRGNIGGQSNATTLPRDDPDNVNSGDIQDYDPLDIDYLRRSELAASKIRSSSQIAMEEGYANEWRHSSKLFLFSF